MSKNFMKAGFVVIFILLLGHITTLRAGQSDYYRMDKAQCAKYIEMSQNALDNNNFYEALLYAKKAVQADSWNKVAWNNYNMVLIRITGGNANLMPNPKKKEEAQPKEAPEAEGEEEEIEGC